jgi:hypothetical protein
MKITIPDDFGDIKVLPEGPCTAILSGIFPGTSKSRQPKLTFKWTINSEMYDDPKDGSTVGETVLDTYSLQPQALWRLNEVYKAQTGENLPQGDYDIDGLVKILEEELLHEEANLELLTDLHPDTKAEMTKVNKITYS